MQADVRQWSSAGAAARCTQPRASAHTRECVGSIPRADERASDGRRSRIRQVRPARVRTALSQVRDNFLTSVFGERLACTSTRAHRARRAPATTRVVVSHFPSIYAYPRDRHTSQRTALTRAACRREFDRLYLRSCGEARIGMPVAAGVGASVRAGGGCCLRCVQRRRQQ